MDNRVVVPEILDELPADDPEAIRSRRDLRVINAFMGNYRWLARQMILHSAGRQNFKWLELGAGEGLLAQNLPADSRERLNISAVDLAPRPAHWPTVWDWKQGDLFDILVDGKFDGVLANLFLHHFDADALEEIGRCLSNTSILIFSEPIRAPLHHWQGKILDPFVNRVTRHDMHVSIDAGFRDNELATDLRLSPTEWDLELSETFFGAYRLIAHAK